MTDNLRPYDRQEWEKIAFEWLASKASTASMLESANIALRLDNPELAEKCKEEAARKRKQSYGKY